MSPSPRPFKRCCCAGLVFVPFLLAAGSYGLVRDNWAAETEADLAALESEGVGLRDLDSLLAVTVSAEENGAEPMLEASELFDQAGLPSPVQDLLGMEFSRVQLGLQDPTSEEVSIYEAVEAGSSHDLAASVALITSRYALVRPLVRASLELPEFRFPEQPIRGARTPDSSLSLRHLLYAASASAASSLGRTGSERAWEDVLLWLRILERLDEPTLIDYLAECALVDHVANWVVQLNTVASPTSKQSEVIRSLLGRLEDLEAPRRVLRTNFSIWLLNMDDPAALAEQRHLEESALKRAFLWPRYRRDFVRLARTWLKGAESSWSLTDPFPSTPQPTTTFVLTHSKMFPLFHAKIVSRVAALRMATASLLLSEDPEAVLPADPWDPAGGNLRRGRDSDGRPLVWSVGRNRKDDGGQTFYDPVEELLLPGLATEGDERDYVAILSPYVKPASRER